MKKTLPTVSTFSSEGGGREEGLDNDERSVSSAAGDPGTGVSGAGDSGRFTALKDKRTRGPEHA